LKTAGLFASSLVLALALTIGAALAQGPGPGRGFGQGPGQGSGWGYGAPTASILKLTEEQSSKITALQKAHFKEIASLQHELSTKRIELRNLLLNPNRDEATARTKQKEIQNFQLLFQDKMTNLRMEIRKVLTPEQQAQMDAYEPRFNRGMGRVNHGGPMAGERDGMRALPPPVQERNR
jgi:Spy/CpxP family protein refolding chaperone